MSDYSYVIVHVEPPRPRLQGWLRVKSWFRVVSVWTEAIGNGWTGKKVIRREWEVCRGQARSVGIVHSGCTPKPQGQYQCRCVTGVVGPPAPVPVAAPDEESCDDPPECSCAMNESYQRTCDLHGEDATCPDCREPWIDHSPGRPVERTRGHEEDERE